MIQQPYYGFVLWLCIMDTMDMYYRYVLYYGYNTMALYCDLKDERESIREERNFSNDVYSL